MPGLYAPDEYDLAGFAVGLVDEEKILDPANAREGDVLIGLGSSGVHSNGFSLVRKILTDSKTSLDAYTDELGAAIGEALLRPTKIYVKPVLALLREVRVTSIAHITGGGFYENIPRALPDGLSAHIDRAAIDTPPLFPLLQRLGSIPDRDMFNVFNMGVGMCIVVPEEESNRALGVLARAGEQAAVIGRLVKGAREALVTA
jgi:phosphoribosylformylglycinamidine cyclo-ligase